MFPPAAADLRERIVFGEYAAAGPVPYTPERPPVLDRRVGDLAPAELAGLAAVRADYDAAKAAYRAAWAAYQRDEAAGFARFRADVEAACDLPPGDPFVTAMWAVARDDLRDFGLDALLCRFCTLLPLWRVYAAARAGAAPAA